MQGVDFAANNPSTSKSIPELARRHGISEQTLYAWRRNLKVQGVPVPGNGKNAEEWSSKDKFSVVLETAGLNEAELAEYPRAKRDYITNRRYRKIKKWGID